MWKPTANYISLHYCWIVFCSILAFPVLGPYGNLSAVDVFFFGCSASTESGLNTVDLKELKLYQQLYVYVIPIITNLCFINVMVVVVRLYWFHRRINTLKPTSEASRADAGEARGAGPKAPAAASPSLAQDHRSAQRDTATEESVKEGQEQSQQREEPAAGAHRPGEAPRSKTDPEIAPVQRRTSIKFDEGTAPEQAPRSKPEPEITPAQRSTSIKFDDGTVPGTNAAAAEGFVALRIPGPRERDRGHPILEVPADRVSVVQLDEQADDDGFLNPLSHTQTAGPSRRFHPSPAPARRRFSQGDRRLSFTRSVEKAASNMLVLGPTRTFTAPEIRPRSAGASSLANLPQMSRQVTVGRNSKFFNMTEHDREVLGGIEYRSLKLLLKIASSYFIGLHFFGLICLLPWIHANAGSKYTDWLDENGLDWSWWAIYSAQTMANNLGFTLTPDSMVTFRDATWPMLVMTFMAFAGNTCYPVFLRLIIWTMSKLVRKQSAIKEHLQFLLDHPRRCYTLLFPSKPTWVLFGILFVLNFVDVLLIIVLDLDNPAVASPDLASPGPRILAALFQAASARHTGTATFNLADVNPAVQFSLICMMYVAVFPIAISIRASNTDEDRALGIYPADAGFDLDERSGLEYVTAHVRNQLSFDLWYIFLGTFCICIAESERIMDKTDPAFSVFPVFFEVVSAYGNVGLSLGHPTVATSMSGQLTTFSKVVICAMMIRGRHRGLPNSIDRSIMLPGDSSEDDERRQRPELRNLLSDRDDNDAPAAKAQ